MSQSKPRYNEIDLLRGIACLSVVAFHYLFRGERAHWIDSHASAPIEAVAKFGFLGVDLFFMISGFVIFMSAEKSSAREFLASRVSRLYPAFWVAAPLTALIAWLFASADFQVSAVSVLANLTMVPHWLGFDFVDGVYWSLAVELHFYIAVGIVLTWGKIDQVERFVAAWLLVCLVYAVRPIYMLDLFLNARYGAYFCAGICAYLIRTRGVSASRLGMFAAAYVVAVLGMLLPEYRGEHRIPQDVSAWIASGIVTLFFVLFLAIARRKWTMESSLVTRWSGRLTYPVYLLHQNIGYILIGALTSFIPSFAGRLLVVVVVVVAAAYLICNFVERPLSRRLSALILPARVETSTAAN